MPRSARRRSLGHRAQAFQHRRRGNAGRRCGPGVALLRRMVLLAAVQLIATISVPLRHDLGPSLPASAGFFLSTAASRSRFCKILLVTSVTSLHAVFGIEALENIFFFLER